MDQGLVGQMGEMSQAEASRETPTLIPATKKGLATIAASWPGPLRRRGPILRPARPPGSLLSSPSPQEQPSLSLGDEEVKAGAALSPDLGASPPSPA